MKRPRWSFALLILAAFSWTCSEEHKGITAPDGNVSVTPSDQDFGDVPIDSCSEQMFTIKNVSSAASVGTVTTLAPFTISSGDNFNLRPGDSVRLVVRFCPKDTVLHQAEIVITGDKQVAVRVRGRGMPRVKREVNIYVDPDAPPDGNGASGRPYASIQHAIDVGQPGDTIRLAAKTFHEAVVISKSIALRGSITAAETTVIAPPRLRSATRCRMSNWRPSTASEGHSTKPPAFPYMNSDILIGIDLTWESGPQQLVTSLTDARVEGFDLGAMADAPEGSEVKVTNIEFRHCKSALFLTGAGRKVVADCLFQLNGGDSLDVICGGDNSDWLRCHFISNRGLAILALPPPPSIVQDCEFIKCFATSIVSSAGSSHIERTTIRNCRPYRVASVPPWASWAISSIAHPTCDAAPCELTLEDVAVLNNQMGVLSALGSSAADAFTVRLSGCTLIGNQSQTNLATFSGCTAVIENCNVIGNDLEASRLEEYQSGGLSFESMSSVSIKNTIMAGNGNLGISLFGLLPDGRCTVSNCTIAFNDNSNHADPCASEGIRAISYPASVAIGNSIIAYNALGITGDVWAVSSGCNDVFQNGCADGDQFHARDYYGVCTLYNSDRLSCGPGSSDIAIPPDFRDPLRLDFRLQPDSPLLSTSCGPIGATR